MYAWLMPIENRNLDLNTFVVQNSYYKYKGEIFILISPTNLEHVALTILNVRLSVSHWRDRQHAQKYYGSLRKTPGCF